MSLSLSSVVVNKAELAKRLGVSLPTMSALIDRYPGFPVITRGTNGTAWQFDLAAVIAFVQSRREEEAQTKAARDEQLAQLVLPIDLGPEPPRGISIKDQIEAAKLRDTLRKEAIANGELVPAADIEDTYTTLFATWSRRLREFVNQLGREQRWPDAVLADAQARLAALQEQLVDDAPNVMPPRSSDDRQSRLV